MNTCVPIVYLLIVSSSNLHSSFFAFLVAIIPAVVIVAGFEAMFFLIQF